MVIVFLLTPLWLSLFSISLQHLVQHPTGAGRAVAGTGALAAAGQVIDYGLDQWLLDMGRIGDGKFGRAGGCG
jgi:hypothetical protein